MSRLEGHSADETSLSKQIAAIIEVTSALANETDSEKQFDGATAAFDELIVLLALVGVPVDRALNATVSYGISWLAEIEGGAEVISKMVRSADAIEHIPAPSETITET